MFRTYPHRRPTTIGTHIGHLLTSHYLCRSGHVIRDDAYGRDLQNRRLKEICWREKKLKQELSMLPHNTQNQLRLNAELHQRLRKIELREE